MLATSIKKPFLVILYGLKSCNGGKCTPTATLGPKTGGNYYNEYVMMVCSFRDCGLVAACSSARQG